MLLVSSPHFLWKPQTLVHHILGFLQAFLAILLSLLCFICPALRRTVRGGMCGFGPYNFPFQIPEDAVRGPSGTPSGQPDIQIVPLYPVVHYKCNCISVPRSARFYPWLFHSRR